MVKHADIDHTGVPGVGGAADTPVIEGYELALVNNTNVGTVNIPAAAAAGHYLVLFGTHGFNPPSSLTGWHMVNFTNELSSLNGLLAVKVAEAGDISAGSVSITFSGAYYGELILVAVSGVRKMNFGFIYGGNPLKIAVRGSTWSQAVIPVWGAGVGDLCLYMAGVRGSNSTISVDRGTVLQQRNADTEAGSVLASETLTAPGPVAPTFTPSVGSVTIAVLVALSG